MFGFILALIFLVPPIVQGFSRVATVRHTLTNDATLNFISRIPRQGSSEKLQFHCEFVPALAPRCHRRQHKLAASESSGGIENDLSNDVLSVDNHLDPADDEQKERNFLRSLVPVASIVLVSVLTAAGASLAFNSVLLSNSAISDAATTSLFDPSLFQPVCPASDQLYQFLKSVANSLIGAENVVQYGPLIAGVLLRIRLELCVFESFLYEAVLPFVQQKGLSWILPLHETLETFLAGTIFAVASNFILLGSTKIFAVIMIYIDALLGFPTRILGRTIKRFTKEKSMGKTTGQVLNVAGDVVGGVRKAVEVFDTFVGRYLVFSTTVYIVFKFLHYKFFNYLF